MECVTGVPFLYDPSGALVGCAHPVQINSISDAADEFLYLADRLPTYIVAGGYLLGLIVMLVAALVVKQLVT